MHLLLARGADVNAQGGRYRNALSAACESRRKDIVEPLLEKGADINGLNAGYYRTTLQATCEKGNYEMVHFMLERGADVNAQGGQHGNALQAGQTACYIGTAGK